MPSRRCSLCGFSYPLSAALNKCPVHNTDLVWLHGEADEDWLERMRALKAERDRAERTDGLIPFPYIPEAPVTEKDGRYFVCTWDVHAYEGVPSSLEEGALLQIGDDIFEIEGRIESLRMYFMRRFTTRCPDTVRECFPPKKRRRKKT